MIRLQATSQILVWVFVCLSAIATATAATAEPYRPSDASEILQTLPEPSTASQRELRGLRAKLAQDPMNLRLAVSVARRYIERARSEADPRYHGYAQAALAPWWDKAEPPAKVLLLRAIVHLALLQHWQGATRGCSAGEVQ